MMSLRSSQAKVLAIVLSASAATLLAWYLRSRRRRSDAAVPAYISASSLLATGDRQPTDCATRSRPSGSSCGRRKRSSLHSGSVRRLRAISPNLTTCKHPECHSDDESTMPQDPARLGIAALQHVITALETSLEQFDAYTQQGSGLNGDESVMGELRNLLQQAYDIRERAKQRVLTEDDGYCPSTDASLSDTDTDSFVSAAEELDISDLDLQLKTSDAYLYRLALMEIEKDNVLYRKLRTSALGCASDTEYLARLHCIRLACDKVLDDKQMAGWMRIAGKEIGTLLLDRLGYDAQPFEAAYNEMIEFLGTADGIETMRRDLLPKGLRVCTLYDIAIDFVLLDAFDVLESPPQSILTVLQNRWLSNSFKKRALDNTIWTLVMAKRKLLNAENGFLYMFYALCAGLTPALAWGFLGPEERCRDICLTFKDRLQQFAKDLFNPMVMRFTTVDELADDVMAQTRTLMASLRSELSTEM